MDTNVGATDQSVRAIIGAVAGAVSLALLSGLVAGPALLSPVLGIVALVMFGTATTNSCPIYSVLGMSTCPRDPAQ